MAPVGIMEGGRRFFIHQPGLTGVLDTVSFEAADWPDYYLRHSDTYLYINLRGKCNIEGFSLGPSLFENMYHNTVSVRSLDYVGCVLHCLHMGTNSASD